MACGFSKHPFFQKLREVACSVTNDVNNVKRELQKSKCDLPENNALLKLVQLTDDMDNLKNKSSAILPQLTEDNKKYTFYLRDVDDLISEMGININQVEESLSKYGYTKLKSEHLLHGDSEDEVQPAGCNTLSFKERQLTENKIAEQKKKHFSPKTPVLADYGLTTKIPKPISSALKVQQGSRVKSVKKVHFESPRQRGKGKENEVPYSLQKTPLLDNYGLSSRKCNVEINHEMDFQSIKKELNFRSPLRQPDKGTKNQIPYSLQRTPLLEDYGLPSRKLNIEMNQGMDLLPVKKELNFRSPLSSISESVAEYNETVALRPADVDDSENFEELLSSFPLAMKITQPGITFQSQTDVKMSPEEPVMSPLSYAFKANISTPEEPRLFGSQRIQLQKKVLTTPEEPQLEPVSLSKFTIKNVLTTPEEPELEPVRLSKSTIKVVPSTPKTPKLDVKLSSFDEWLQLQKKKHTYK